MSSCASLLSGKFNQGGKIMKICPECGASNSDTAKFCNECGAALETITAEKSKAELPAGGGKLSMEAPAEPAGLLDAASLAQSLSMRVESLQGKRRADILFVLDCTGSMQGEIDAIRDAITAFADSIESEGVRARVGLIEFRDRLIGEEHRVLSFDGQTFTNDPAAFRREVSKLRAKGGGDEPESSLDAVMLALHQPFAEGANKVIVLVTDASPHIPDREEKSIEEVVQAIRTVGVHQFYLVFHTQHPKSQIYLKLLEGTRGMAFELGKGDDFRSRSEDFKRTLMSLGKTISSATR
jgi:Mg-chelatase subunit ChlD